MVMKMGLTTRNATEKTISVTKMAMRPARRLMGGIQAAVGAVGLWLQK
jgi:hypothetical protein